jgi:nicotinate-nucleotide adenylyltransferase
MNISYKNYKYALFGGTFDPVHNGHIRLAKAAAYELSLDKLFFMPNFISPFKKDTKVTAVEDRCAMLNIACRTNDKFIVSRYEVDRQTPSYTYNTLTFFDNNYDGKLYFLLGFDSLMQIDTWYKGEEILKSFTLVTGRRPGTESSVGLEKIEDYKAKYNADIILLDVEPYDASSTEIRQLVAYGKSLSGIVLPEVENYINEHNLYR